jgi:hypothetical protein
MKYNYRLGFYLALVAAILGIVGHLVLFPNWYHTGMAAESAEPGCEILLKYIHPLMSDLGLLGGVFFLVSAVGYYKEERWAFLLSSMGLVLALLGSWFINVPYMAAGLPPVYFILFWPYLILYFLFARSVGKLPWNRTVLALLMGIAYIFCCMNGISSTSRIITHGLPLFMQVQRLHFVAMAGFAVVTVGIMILPKSWMRVVWLTSVVIELVVGLPLAFATTMQLGRFSLFALGPIAAIILLVLYFLPKYWDRIAATAE